MICSSCNTEAFAWMAEVFACPVCGSRKYVFPMFIEADLVQHIEQNILEDGESAPGGMRSEDFVEQVHRKRKRVPSDSEMS